VGIFIRVFQTLRTDPIAAFEPSSKKVASANDFATLRALSAVEFSKIMATYSTGEWNDARKNFAHAVKIIQRVMEGL